MAILDVKAFDKMANDDRVVKFIDKTENKINDSIIKYAKMSKDKKKKIYRKNDNCIIKLDTEYSIYNGFGNSYAKTKFGKKMDRFGFDQQKLIRDQINTDFTAKGWKADWTEKSYIDSYGAKCFYYILKINH